MLIRPDTPWPLPGDQTMRDHWASHRAWWSGDLRQLKEHTPLTAPGGYWQRMRDKESPWQMHMPLAKDIARTSAGLVFADRPQITFAETNVQDEWERVSEEIGWGNSLIEFGETCAALGEGYLRPQWDRTVSDEPLLTIVRPADAIPTWRYGRLAAVTFVTVLDPDPTNTLRWLEHHEPGQIRHELWRGTNANIGRLVLLTEHATTAGLATPENGGGIIDTRPIRPDGRLLVDWAPNMGPNPLTDLPHGVSDYQSLETGLDRLDATWSAWMRELDLGMLRIITPGEYLSPMAAHDSVMRRVSSATASFFNSRRSSSASRSFDIDAAVFTPFDMSVDHDGVPTMPTPVQFALRTEQYAQTCKELREDIIGRAGYAPQTYGINIDGQLSGAAMRRRTIRSHDTKNRKRPYLKPAVGRTAETLMLINHVVFGKPKPEARPTLLWKDTDQSDPVETAQTIELLKRAEAVSLEMRVRMAHPDWDDPEVLAEVDAIKKETPAAPALSGFEPPENTDLPDGLPAADDEA